MSRIQADVRRAILWLPTALAATVALGLFTYFLYLVDFFPDPIEEWLVGLGWMFNAEMSYDLGRKCSSIAGALLSAFVMFGITFCMIVRAMRELESERLRVIDLATRSNRARR
jgi:hypothetical protein